MNPTHRDIRARLQSMAPQRAVSFIAGLELPGDEAYCIIECDVRRQSYALVANKLHMSVDGLCKLRRRAYQKLADYVKNT